MIFLVELLAKKAHLVKLVKKLGGDTSIQNMHILGVPCSGLFSRIEIHKIASYVHL